MAQFNIELRWSKNGKIIRFFFTTDLLTLNQIVKDHREKGNDILAFFGRIYD